MNLDTLNQAELYAEIAELAREAGVNTQDTWNELCDEVIDSHVDIGELNDDQDLGGIAEVLHQMWAEYARESGPESLNAISEDPESPRA